MKKFSFAAAIACAAIFMTSCASETTHFEEPINESINIMVEKPVVEVENFDEVDYSTTSNLSFDLNDGNVATAKLNGLTPKGLRFSYKDVTEVSRTVEVQLIAANKAGEQRTATTRYQQRKVVEAPVEVVSARLEADTLMLYQPSSVMMRLDVRRVYVYSDKHEETETIVSGAVFTVVEMPCSELGTQFISTGEAVDKVVFWNGCERTLKSEKTFEKNQCLVAEREEMLRYSVEALSDAAEKCDISSSSCLTTRDVAFTDAETGLSLEYKFRFSSEFVEAKVEDRGLSVLTNQNGTFTYDGTYVVKFNHQVNGVNYSGRTLKTDVFSK